jgi:hypothetical protein
MPSLLKFACVSSPLWLLWAVLILAASPQPPGRSAQMAFVVSMVAALIGSVWASWGAFPQHARKRWRRIATVLLGLIGVAVGPHHP